MSGGSYDYLYSRTAREFLEERNYRDNLLEMAADLENEDNGQQASSEAIFILETIQLVITLMEQVDNRLRPLRKVFKAMEWYRSNDWGYDDVVSAIQDYNRRCNFG